VSAPRKLMTDVEGVAQPNEAVDLSTNFVIEYSQLQFGVKIQSGGWGIVYAGTWNGRPVAIKQLHNFTESAVNNFRQESETLKKIQKYALKNVVQYVGFAESMNPQSYNIVMEFVPCGDIWDFLNNNRHLFRRNPLTCYNLLVKIANAVLKLHDIDMAHVDLKPENLLLTEDGDIKLADFGFSVMLGTESYKKVLKENRGTPFYMAPEVISTARVSKASDMFSLGGIIYAIVHDNRPFSHIINNMRVLKLVSEGRRAQISHDCPPTLAALIRMCWKHEAEERPTAKFVYTELKNLADLENSKSNAVSTSVSDPVTSFYELQRAYFTADTDYERASIFDLLTELGKKPLPAEERHQLDNTLAISDFLHGNLPIVPVDDLCDMLLFIKEKHSLYILMSAMKNALINKITFTVLELKVFLQRTHVFLKDISELFIAIFILKNKDALNFDFLVRLSDAIPSACRKLFLDKAQQSSSATAFASFLVYEGDIKELDRVMPCVIENDALFKEAISVARDELMLSHMIELKIKLLLAKNAIDEELLVFAMTKIIDPSVLISVVGFECDAISRFTVSLLGLPSASYNMMKTILKDQVKKLSRDYDAPVTNRNRLFSPIQEIKNDNVVLAPQKPGVY
jgi:serine/threonine protein kinase